MNGKAKPDWAATAFSILMYTESMQSSGFFLKKTPTPMLS